MCDSPDTFELKISQLLTLLSQSKHTIVCTGAGISTASGVPDFRGDRGLATIGVANLNEAALDWTMPSLSHMAIVRLLEHKAVHFVVTSNHDDIHRRSGVPPGLIAELFGNAYVERCVACHAQFRRATQPPSLGRACEACGGRLVRTGVRFGQATPEEPLARAQEQGGCADCALVLGSSMTVSPFCNIPPMAKHMVIVNLKETPYDSQADIKFNATCDAVMQRVLQYYKIDIGNYEFKQEFVIGYRCSGDSTTMKLVVESGRMNESVTCVEEATVAVGQKVVKLQETKLGFEGKLDWNELATVNDGETMFAFTLQFKEQFGVDPQQHTVKITDLHCHPQNQHLLPCKISKLITYN